MDVRRPASNRAGIIRRLIEQLTGEPYSQQQHNILRPDNRRTGTRIFPEYPNPEIVFRSRLVHVPRVLPAERADYFCDIFHLYCQFDCFRVRHLSTYFRHHGVDRVHDKEGSHFDWQPGSHGFDRGDSCFAGEPFPEERDYESRNLIPGRRDFRRFDGF